MQRRSLLKGAALGIVGGPSVALGQVGPFSLPTAQFNKANQHKYPLWAFRRELPPVLVPRPTAIGTWKELMEGSRSPFGPGDSTRPGDCFHGIAREWGETPPHWKRYGCDPSKSGWEGWKDKAEHFGSVRSYEDPTKKLRNWGGGEACCFPVKCYKISMEEAFVPLRPDTAFPARLYAYSGMIPGPTLKMRLGQPVVVRFENHLETETSIHLHGGHSPSHADGFPSFYVLQGKSRDYFYPNILPLYFDASKKAFFPDIGEGQSTMWYHDHAMDATAYNVSKGLAGMAPCFGEEELALIARGVLPGLGKDSCFDPELCELQATKTDPDPLKLEHPEFPGFYKHEKGKEPYFNPYDIPLVLQDRVIDLATGQVAYDNTGHNGYIGDTMLVNGIAWPKCSVERRKYRFRILDGSNARVFRLRLMSAANFYAANEHGVDKAGKDENAPVTVAERPAQYDAVSEPYLRIGKDSWLWSHAVQKKHMVLMMANRADIVVDFGALTRDLDPGETHEFFLVNTMPQFDGRGPKAKLEDGGDPRVLPVPFDVVGVEGTEDIRLVETNRPIPLIKFVVHGPRLKPGEDASVEHNTPLWIPELREEGNRGDKHRRIQDNEIRAVREFVFERGKGAWQINGRFYDPTIANAGPVLDGAEEWVLRNGGGGWWHPIHIHLESHQLVRYEKDFAADEIVDRQDPPAPVVLNGLQDLTRAIGAVEVSGNHDTTALGPNTVARIRMRHRTWNGPFVFHCHNVEHEDMRMMFNFEPVPANGTEQPADLRPNLAPTARTHGNEVTLNGGARNGQRIGELAWEYPPVPRTPAADAGEDLISPRPKTLP